MYIHKLNKQNLLELGKQGYKVVPCDNREEQAAIYNSLKIQGNCARASTIKNKSGETILFVLTKSNERRKKVSSDGK